MGLFLGQLGATPFLTGLDLRGKFPAVLSVTHLLLRTCLMEEGNLGGDWWILGMRS